MATGGDEDNFDGKLDTRWRQPHSKGSSGHSGLIRKICGSNVDGNDWRLPEGSGLTACPLGVEAEVGWMSLNKRGRFHLLDQLRDRRGLIDAQSDGLNVSCVEKCHNAELEPISKATRRVTAEHSINPNSFATNKTPKGKFRHDQPLQNDPDGTTVDSVRYEICLPTASPHLLQKLIKDARKNEGGTKVRNRTRKNFSQVEMDADHMDDIWSDEDFDDDSVPNERIPVDHSIADFMVTPEQQQQTKRQRNRNSPNHSTTVHVDNSKESDKPRLLRLLTQIDEVLQTPTVPTTDRSTRPTFEMSPVELNILAEHLEPNRLENQFGQRYVECPTIPRRFIIDLTDAARTEVFRRQSTSISRPDVQVACVIEVEQDEFDLVDEEGKLIKRCRLSVNGSFTRALHDTKCEFINPSMTHSVDEVLDGTIKMIGAYPKETYRVMLAEDYWRQPPVVKSAATVCPVPTVDCVVETVPSALAAQMVMKESTGQAKLNAVGTSQACLKVDICGICAVDCADLWGLSGCGHLFCPECWRSYLIEKIRSESITLPCPDYGCDHFVDFDTLRSCVDLPLCNRYAEQICHHFLVNRASEWLKCPQNQCGRLVRLSTASASEAVVNCNCGATWCSACQSDAHWPASCDQAEIYRAKLKELGDYMRDEKPLGKLTSVRVRRCPHCFILMEKVVGCDHIVCRCGKQFCYACGQDYDKHVNCQPRAAENMLKKIAFVDVPKSKRPQMWGSWYDRCCGHHSSLQPRSLNDFERQMRKCRSTWTAGDLTDPLVGIYRQSHSTLEFVHLWLHFGKNDMKQPQRLAQLASTLEFLLLRVEEAAEDGQADRLAYLLPPILTALKTLISAAMMEKRR